MLQANSLRKAQIVSLSLSRIEPGQDTLDLNLDLVSLRWPLPLWDMQRVTTKVIATRISLH